MSKNICTLSSIAALLMGSSFALAHQSALEGTIEVPDGNGSYVTSSSGNALRTGSGNCVNTGSHSDENIVNACAGIDDAAVEAEEVEEEKVMVDEEAAPAPEPIAKEPIVSTATLGGEALFDRNSAELTGSSEDSIANLVNQLQKFQEITSIEVVGHTDSRGDEASNQELSEARASAVEAYLKAAYPDAAITSRGVGESSPIATNSTSAGRALNRRVEVQVTAKSISE